jgi:predicted nucleic acid-binding protein
MKRVKGSVEGEIWVEKDGAVALPASFLRLARKRGLRHFDTLIAGLCIESRLPLLTGPPKNYRGVRSLKVIPANHAVDAAKAELFGA